MRQVDTERLGVSGYEEIFTGAFVAEEDAFVYALENCVEIAPDGFHEIKWKEEFKNMLVEWFYSGEEWVRKNDK